MNTPLAGTLAFTVTALLTGRPWALALMAVVAMAYAWRRRRRSPGPRHTYLRRPGLVRAGAGLGLGFQLGAHPLRSLAPAPVVALAAMMLAAKAVLSVILGGMVLAGPLLAGLAAAGDHLGWLPAATGGGR